MTFIGMLFHNQTINHLEINLMKKVLRFEMKQNLRRPTRIYVKSPDLKTSYGYFHADNPSSFDGWSLLTEEQTTELALFIQNIEAINALLGSEASNN